MKVLITIAARGGSKGLKDKNIRPLCGKPLVAYTIEQALRWGKAERIAVSTDSIGAQVNSFIIPGSRISLPAIRASG